MLLRTMTLCLLSWGLLACGGDDGGGDGGGGLSDLFESLNGEYQLDEDLDCVISVLGSRVGTRTQSGATTCSDGEVGGHRETLMVQGTLSDTRLTAHIVYEEVGGVEVIGGCDLTHTTHTEIEGSATKSMGRSAEGRFAGLAGVWEGQVTIVETDITDECAGDSGTETNTYHFMADVFGSFGSITYEGGDDIDTFDFAESGAGEIIIDGENISIH